jgi:hypothetical protein
MQKQDYFEYTIRRARWEFALNGKLVSQKAKCPTLGNKN